MCRERPLLRPSMPFTFQLKRHLLRGPPLPSHDSVTSQVTLTPSPYFNSLHGTHHQLVFLLCFFTGCLSHENVISTSEGPCLPRLACLAHSRCSVNSCHIHKLIHNYPCFSAPVCHCRQLSRPGLPGEGLRPLAAISFLGGPSLPLTPVGGGRANLESSREVD